ncbi:MAG: alpha/beta hydrolase [Bacteroidales bacterium]|nr:alpha/beta hydrolase [Bacteroidales bacterium]MCF8404873.1 alpha/beta hydrolase [Bacteroidales bacterium]
MERKLVLSGNTVSYRLEGKGNTIVLLHGFLESKTMWNFFSRQLSKKFQVLSIDLPGHGKTDVFSQIHTMKLMAEVVNTVLENERISKCAMVGHSMGGYVTAEFASLFAAKLSGICFFHSQVEGDDDEAKKNRDRTIELIEKYKVSFIRSFIPDLFAPENLELYTSDIEKLKAEAGLMTEGAIVSALHGMKQRMDYLELISTLPFPVAFVAGKKDVRIPLEKIFSQVKIPPHGEILVMENVGHMGHIESKEKTLAFVQSFCERLW